MQLQLDSRYDAVVRYIAEASAPGVSPDIQAHLCRFGTVLVCGYVERAVEIIVIERLTSRAQTRVLNFIRSNFKRGRNLDASAVAELLNRFDPGWYRKFDTFINANSRVRDGVSSCYGLRNTIAHGGTASVTAMRLNELLQAAKDMVDAIVLATR